MQHRQNSFEMTKVIWGRQRSND